MRRALTAWLVALGVAIAAGAVGVAALNATVFGASGFVRVYLDALARGDVAGARGLPGVVVDGSAGDDLLRTDALARLDIRDVTVERRDAGIETVAVTWTADSEETVTTFAVERIGTRFGLFPEWGFAESPLATLRLTVEHDERFVVNGVDLVTGVAAAEPVDYAVFVPGVYRVGHESTYLDADELEVVAAHPATPIERTLEVLPAPAFVEQVTTEVHDHLAACATQEVLFPTGCPLGRAIPNRVVSTPEWSIVEFPELAVEPTDEFGVWEIPAAAVVAHLRVDVQSLFDGSVSTFDEDIPFDVRYLVTIDPDDTTLRIVAQYD